MAEELIKTKKNWPVKKMLKLSQLKESVCSYNDNFDQNERFEESQILVDYFHPKDSKLMEMKELMKRERLLSTDSFTIQEE